MDFWLMKNLWKNPNEKKKKKKPNTHTHTKGIIYPKKVFTI